LAEKRALLLEDYPGEKKQGISRGKKGNVEGTRGRQGGVFPGWKTRLGLERKGKAKEREIDSGGTRAKEQPQMTGSEE